MTDDFDWKKARQAVEYARWSDRHEQARTRLVFLLDDQRSIERKIAATRSEMMVCIQELEQLDA